MQYKIPTKVEELLALRQSPIDEELVAIAITGVVKIAREKGCSLTDLTNEIMSEDPFLDRVQRRWLSDILTQAWNSIPF
jgi:hypothetical protein